MVVVNRRLFQVSFDTIRRVIGININAALLCMVVGYQYISQIQNVTYTGFNRQLCRRIGFSNVGLYIDGTTIGFSSITADCTFFDGNTAVISCPNCAPPSRLVAVLLVIVPFFIRKREPLPVR